MSAAARPSRCSVTSSWVATQPPSPIGRLAMAMKRPSCSRTLVMVLPLAMLLSRSAMYWSGLPEKLPTLMRWSSRSRSDDARPGQLGRELVHLDVALVAQDQPAVGAPHAQALRHVVERGGQPHVVSRGRHTRRQGQGQQTQRRAGDRHRQRGGRQREFIDGAAGIRNDLSRAHGGEVMRDDGQRQQRGGEDGGAGPSSRMATASAAIPNSMPSRMDVTTRSDRPCDMARHFERPHAEIVHAGDAERRRSRRRSARPSAVAARRRRRSRSR